MIFIKRSIFITSAVFILILSIISLTVFRANYSKTASLALFNNQQTIIIDADGEVINVLNGVSNGAEFSMPMSESCLEMTQTLNKGDIVCVDTNFFGDTIYKVTKAFDAKTRTFEPYAAFTNRDRYWYATDETGNDSSKWRNATRQMTKSFAYDQKNVAISSSYTLSDAKEGVVQIVSR